MLQQVGSSESNPEMPLASASEPDALHIMHSISPCLAYPAFSNSKSSTCDSVRSIMPDHA